MRLLLVVLLAAPAVAAPRDLPFTWTSRTAAAGEDQLEAWITPRIARTDDFLQLDTRLAWTHGVARTIESQLSMDFDFQRTDKRDGVDTRLEESFAVKFALSPNAGFALELRAKSSWQRREYQGTAAYAGPALTWTHPAFWVTLGAYAQVAADKAQADRPLAEPQELRDNERFVLRLAFGAVTRK